MELKSSQVKTARNKQALKKMASPRSRAWCYTINNYTEEDVASVRALDAVYNIFGYEVGEQGTPHLQGYVYFKTNLTRSALSKKIPRASLLVAKGSVAQNFVYCSKEATKDPTKEVKYEEYGKRPMTQKEKGDCNKRRWQLINEKAFEGDEEWLKENEPHVYHTGLATFRSHKKPKTEPMNYADRDTPNEWWVGPTGTGKSKKVWKDFPGHYAKQLTKWWCGYNGESVVVIEEADPKGCDFVARHMKQWADRYPFPGEIKGGRLEGIRPDKVIVTSNYTIRECFPDPRDYEPLERRFKVVHFKKLEGCSGESELD